MSGKGLPSLLDRHWAESALAIGAVIIAAVSLWVAYDSERTNRELVASASWPFVQVYNATVTSASAPPQMIFILSNDGIGPAKLEWFQLFWKGRPQRSPWQLLQTCCAQQESLDALYHDPAVASQTDQGLVLRSGQRLDILTVSRQPENTAIYDALKSQFTGSLSVRYCYCSALNDCWVNSATIGAPRDLNPRQMRACPRPEETYDNTTY